MWKKKKTSWVYLCCQQNVESFMAELRQMEPSTHLPEQLRRLGVDGRRGVALLIQITLFSIWRFTSILFQTFLNSNFELIGSLNGKPNCKIIWLLTIVTKDSNICRFNLHSRFIGGGGNGRREFAKGIAGNAGTSTMKWNETGILHLISKERARTGLTHLVQTLPIGGGGHGRAAAATVVEGVVFDQRAVADQLVDLPSHRLVRLVHFLRGRRDEFDDFRFVSDVLQFGRPQSIFQKGQKSVDWQIATEREIYKFQLKIKKLNQIFLKFLPKETMTRRVMRAGSSMTTPCWRSIIRLMGTIIRKMHRVYAGACAKDSSNIPNRK